MDRDEIFERLKENERIQLRFHRLESRIISILNFKNFFEILLTEMKNIFRIPYVWLTVIEESNLADLINRLNDSEIIRKRTNFIKRSDFDKIFGPMSTPLLVNKDLAPYAVLFPGGNPYPVRSLALAPVQIDGETVGSLNQGDTVATRFEPGMDTSSLQQLMLKVSLCLSNVAAHEKLHYFAYHDPLTGLLNRRAFETELRREFSRFERYGSQLSLVFLDLDVFKRINDRYGHDAGDRVLKYVADTLGSLSRAEDIVARFAGDEFVVILPEATRETAESFVMRIQDHFDRHPLPLNDALLNISISYGVASTGDGGATGPDMLFKKADERLYLVKQTKGKNAGIQA